MTDLAKKSVMVKYTMSIIIVSSNKLHNFCLNVLILILKDIYLFHLRLSCIVIEMGLCESEMTGKTELVSIQKYVFGRTRLHNALTSPQCVLSKSNSSVLRSYCVQIQNGMVGEKF